MPKRRLLFSIHTITLALALSAVVAFGLSRILSKSPHSSTEDLKVLEIAEDKAPLFEWIPLTTLEAQNTDPKPAGPMSPTFILFWASWCYPCWEELKVVGEIEAPLAELGLKVVPIGVAMNEGHLKMAREMWEKLDLSLPLQWDAGEFYQRKYAIEGLPQSLLLDENHRVRKRLIGTLPLYTEQLILFLKEHIALLESDTLQTEKPRQ